MKILVACEFSGIVREAFITQGHDAWSCDFLPSEKIGQHIQGDVREILNTGEWDMIIAFPPCTYLTNSGVRWLYEQKDRWKKMEDAAEFFASFLYADCPHIAVENPIPHKYAMRYIRRGYTQIIQPWMFGHGETKATCLWLKGLLKLQPTNLVEGRDHRVHRESPSKDRWKNRSRMLPGIADAMAQQWGGCEKIK